ncbi:hypothetical protein [Gilliamella sp. Pas-s27]|uniref:hypothetical protein n=1 Tax=Gilliamella sp. Pas-s27 TaxID=2687311 RepID=UPI0013662079|nr:hypothetical protein [Gilliamella sp. Pas-s27]MWP46076.1 hypothetical protein [Gilliamella sp. Pas-s27]
MEQKLISFIFVTEKKRFIRWKRQAEKNNITLQEWIIKKLNSDVKVVYKKVKLQKDIPKDEQWFIRLSTKSEFKGYWVYCSRSDEKKLVEWITCKLDS